MKRKYNKKTSNVSSFIIICLCIIAFIFVLYLSSILHSKKTCNISQFSSDQLVSYFPEKNNKEGDVLFDAYAGPSKNNNIHVRTKDVPSYGIPINVPTRSVDADYRQIGIVTNKNSEGLIMPLIGKPLFTDRDKWQYFVLNKQNIKLPVIVNGKNSTNEYGTNSLSNKDSVSISGYSNGNEFEVELYENNQFNYIPL